MFIKSLNESWKSSFIQFFVLICVVILVVGCADSEDDAPPPPSSTPPQNSYASDDPGDRLAWTLDLDPYVENEQGIEGAPDYGSGNPPYMLQKHFPDGTVATFYADTEDGRIHGALHLPDGWDNPSYVSGLQLILIMTSQREATGKTRLYQSGSVELYHVTVDCELREAATMEIVATQTFEGNNSFPSTVVWGTSTTSDRINSQIVEDWLQPYVNP